jgi:hypothetical protein
MPRAPSSNSHCRAPSIFREMLFRRRLSEPDFSQFKTEYESADDGDDSGQRRNTTDLTGDRRRDRGRHRLGQHLPAEQPSGGATPRDIEEQAETCDYSCDYLMKGQNGGPSQIIDNVVHSAGLEPATF